MTLNYNLEIRFRGDSSGMQLERRLGVLSGVFYPKRWKQQEARERNITGRFLIFLSPVIIGAVKSRGMVWVRHVALMEKREINTRILWEITRKT
jgi:hypothetical protein